MTDLINLTAAIFSIVVGIYAFIKFIDSRIRKVIKEPEFIKDISSVLRPYAIFDEKERILVDRGAMKYLERIEVRTDSASKLPNKIILHPKQHLEQAPILIALDTDMSETKENRGKGFTWEYDIEYQGYNDREERRFSIEVIK